MKSGSVSNNLQGSLEHPQRHANECKLRRRHLVICLFTIFQLVSNSDAADGFVVAFHPQSRSNKGMVSTRDGRTKIAFPLREASNENDGGENGNASGTYYDDFESFGGGAGRLDVAAVTLSELSFRVHKLSLEEGYTRQLIKSRPRFLPYEDCRGWVMAWGRRWESEKDWKNWIATGEKRNSYIPSRPDEYYGRLGKWISWEHFLGIEGDDDESSSSSSSSSKAPEE